MKKASILILLSIVLLTLFSCSKPSNDELSGFLLVGPYTLISSEGRLNDFSQINEETFKEDSEKGISEYKKIFEYPYSPAVAATGKQILVKDFNVKGNAEAKSKIAEYIKLAENEKNKAFNYSVAANIANLSYAAGYFTKDELLQHNQEILKEVRNNYDDWTPYLQDFLKERASQKKEGQEFFQKVVEEVLLKEPTSPYKNLDI